MVWTCLPIWWPLLKTTEQTWSQRSNTGTALHVHGVDMSTNMVAIAQNYRADMEPEVKHRYSPACSWCNPVYQHGSHCPGLQGRHGARGQTQVQPCMFMVWTCLPIWWPLLRTTGQTWSQRSNTGTALHVHGVDLSTNMWTCLPIWWPLLRTTGQT
jgi:hypothetical protein